MTCIVRHDHDTLFDKRVKKGQHMRFPTQYIYAIAERLQIARAMKSARASIEMIMNVTALSKEEIEQNS